MKVTLNSSTSDDSIQLIVTGDDDENVNTPEDAVLKMLHGYEASAWEYESDTGNLTISFWPE